MTRHRYVGRGARAVLVSAIIAPGWFAQCEVELGYGAVQQCAIQSSGDVAAFTVEADAGDVLFMRMVDATPLAQISPRLSVLLPGDVVPTCTSEGASEAVIDGCVVATQGTLTVTAEDAPPFQDVGAFGLFTQRVNDPVGAKELEFGALVQASVAAAAETHSYVFEADAGDVIRLRMVDDSEFGQLRPALRLFGPGGELLGAAEDEVTALIEGVALGESGTHAVLAYGAGFAATGSYGLLVQRVNAPGLGMGFEVGGTVTGQIDAGGEEDAYSVCLAPGDVLHARALDFSEGGQLRPELRVYDPTGTLVAASVDASDAEVATEPQGAGGAYTILVGQDGFPVAGQYALHVQKLNDACQASSAPAGLLPGVEAAGTLHAGNVADAYVLPAAAGDRLTLSMTDRSPFGVLSPDLRVHAPDGTLLCSGTDAFQVQVVCDLPADGDYLIVATDVDGTSGTLGGDYGLHVETNGVTCAGSFASYGSGSARGDGCIPTLHVDGCPGVDASVQLRISGGLPDGTGGLIVGNEVAALPLLFGGELLLFPVFAIVFPVPLDAVGEAPITMSLPILGPNLVFLLQGFVLDPATAGGYATTGGIELRIP